jgi:hypothetical protein
MIPSSESTSATKGSQMAGWCWTGVFGLLFLFVCYLSLKPSPASVSVPWFPGPMARWFDRHDHWRNLIGFGAFAFAGFKAIARHDALVAITCCLLVVLLELGQLWLPRRTCDWSDIACSSAGIAFAWLAFRGWDHRKHAPGNVAAMPKLAAAQRQSNLARKDEISE